MSRTLYDLAAADPDLRFSPYCWRAKLALAHKKLAVETIPWRFTDREAIAFSGQDLVPVLVDGVKVVHDSQTIAEYLDETYSDEPLFGAQASLTAFIKQWTELTLHPIIVRIVLPDIYKQLDAKDQPYFRRTREARMGKTIEEMAGEQEAALAPFHAALAPLRATLAAQPYLAGAAPAYADYIVLGAIQWACAMSSMELLAADDPISLWRRDVLARLGFDAPSSSVDPVDHA